MVVLGSRSRSPPPPPHVVVQALVEPDSDPARPWLHLAADEVGLRVLRVEGSTVDWSSPFLQRPAAEVHLWGERMDEIINRDLRYSFGQ